jgi:hypothetical protein
VIATLAFTKALEKMVENFTRTHLPNGRTTAEIWDKLRGNPRAENAFTAVEQGNKEELQRLAVYLQDAMEDDPQFANEVLALAQEINAGKLQDNSSMNQYNYDSSTGYQTRIWAGRTLLVELTIMEIRLD